MARTTAPVSVPGERTGINLLYRANCTSLKAGEVCKCKCCTIV